MPISMHSPRILGLVLFALSVPPTTFAEARARPAAAAQQFPFERTFDLKGPAALDVSTLRGRIDVVAGDAGRIVVTGSVTVRANWNVPADALERAQRLAANPPVRADAQTVTLLPPSDATDRRAVTVSYQVRVPPDTRVTTHTDSGATTVKGVNGAVTVHTQSSAIEVARLGSAADVTTGSGAVRIDGVAGALTVSTSSSAITARALGGNVRVRTQSGAVDVALAGSGDVDVETGSSAMRVADLRGGFTAWTQSGHVTAGGTPARPWSVTTGSSAVDLRIDRSAGFSLDAESGSGSVRVDGATVAGPSSKRRVSGDVGSGGPLVRVRSRSGSIVVDAR
jgi:hypothetical protein